MKAMIFAAGLGTRLKPLTDSTQKHYSYQWKPMLEHVILKLKDAGFHQIAINVHHLGDQIINFLAASNNFRYPDPYLRRADYLLDTGGGIKHATAFLQGNEPFLIHNVDILSDIDLRALYNHHIETNPLATLLVSKRNTSRYLLFNKENKLCGWRNRETGEVKSFYPDFDPNQYNEYAFSGIHVLSPKIFDWMEEWTGKFSIINFYLSICAKANIHAYADEDLHLIDVGKPETLQVAEKMDENNLLYNIVYLTKICFFRKSLRNPAFIFLKRTLPQGVTVFPTKTVFIGPTTVFIYKDLGTSRQRGRSPFL